MKIHLYSVFIGLVVFCNTSISAQVDTDLLYGKWDYHDVLNKENMDENQLKMVEAFFSALTFTFSRDESYEAVLVVGAPDKGEWKIENNNIECISQKGENYDVKILKLTKNELHIKLIKGSFILKKIE